MNLPPYDIFPCLHDDTVSLRQVDDLDIKDLVEISFYDGIQARTVEQAIEMQSKISEDYKNGESIHWAIIDNKTSIILGTCGFYRGFKGGAGELGCILLSEYRGQGFMTSAISLAITFGLKQIGLHYITAITNAGNTKAIKLLERQNFLLVPGNQIDMLEYRSQ